MRDVGVEDNKGVLMFACGPKNVLFTANSDTPYVTAVLDLKESGLMVVELPAGPYIGLFNDHNFRWIADMGLTGPDAGKGGKHLVFPLDYKDEPPAGYRTSRSNTRFVFFGSRALPSSGDIHGALEALRQIKVYPLSQSANPPALAFADKTDQPFDTSPLKMGGQPAVLGKAAQGPSGRAGVRGQGWFVYFRLYGPDGPAFDGRWKPGDFEEMK
jgi:hypothetical protein